MWPSKDQGVESQWGTILSEKSRVKSEERESGQI